MTPSAAPEQPTLFGHPTGLFTLFFAEMWERFSFYGMRALLVFYMTKGFLQYDDGRAYAVYGAYGALVYATPFIGGAIADRLLGPRKAVVLGALLMAAGHLMMTIEAAWGFFGALALLIVGNGFFKPNISTMVGDLYPDGSARRDAGFTLFYMGINLGAAMAPLLCGYIGETYGWHWGFGLATIGMLVGTAVFVAPTRITQGLIAVTAVGTAGTMFVLQAGWLTLLVNGFVATALLVAAGAAVTALGRGGLPTTIGLPTHPERLDAKLGPLRAEWVVYVGALASVPLFALLVQRHEVATTLLSIFGGGALLYLAIEAFRSPRVERDRLLVVLALMFFSLLFWAFFEQAGSSMNNFADRNVDRVIETTVVAADDVGETVTLPLSQAQLGYPRDGRPFTLTDLQTARDAGQTELSWELTEAHVGMATDGEEIAASQFQAANPIFILVFGLAFTALWTWLGVRGLEPSEPVKFGLGLIQLGLGFLALWYGATVADGQGMVAVGWLLAGYLLHTTGELCLSPVGLSMVTKLSPKRMVSSVMGAWFLATAFSHLLAGMIATLTGVSSEAGEAPRIPPPQETVALYGDVFGPIGWTAIGAGVLLLLISPLLVRGMHRDHVDPEPS